MFHYWIPKGAGFLGLGCLLISKLTDNRPTNRELKRKFAEQRAQGRGMRLPDGEVMPWGISEAEWKVMHEEWLRTHKKT